MDNYINNTTNGEYYYIDGKYVLISSNDVNTVNFNSDNQYYTINNNFNFLPEPEITNAHQVSYQEQYNNNNYFSNDNNLFNINTNLNTNNIINNNYDYTLNQNQVYIPQNNNSNNYQNNYSLVTPINTRQNPFTNLNSTYIQHNTKNIPNQNISTNIDNNLGINVNNQYNYLNNQTITDIQNQNQIPYNYKLPKPQTQVKIDPNNFNNKLIVKINSKEDISNQKQNILSNESNISNNKTEEKEKTDPYNIKLGYDPILLDILMSTEAALNKMKKEESGDFLCPKCGHRLFGDNLGVGLEKWISRENNGINKIIFYGKDFMGYPAFYGKMEEKYYPEYNDSDDSCGVKRSIHIDSHTELQFKKNNSFEYCWKEAFTDKEWNKYLDNIMCLFCDYKSNFPDFIKDKKKRKR